MKDNGRMTNLMEMGSLFSLMARYIKDSSRKARRAEEENFNLLTEAGTKGISEREISMGREPTNRLKETFMQVNGHKIK